MATSACADWLMYGRVVDEEFGHVDLSYQRSDTARSVACEFHHGTNVVAVSDPLQACCMPTYCADEGKPGYWSVIIMSFITWHVTWGGNPRTNHNCICLPICSCAMKQIGIVCIPRVHSSEYPQDFSKPLHNPFKHVLQVLKFCLYVPLLWKCVRCICVYIYVCVCVWIKFPYCFYSETVLH